MAIVQLTRHPQTSQRRKAFNSHSMCPPSRLIQSLELLTTWQCTRPTQLECPGDACSHSPSLWRARKKFLSCLNGRISASLCSQMSSEQDPCRCILPSTVSSSTPRAACYLPTSRQPAASRPKVMSFIICHLPAAIAGHVAYPMLQIAPQTPSECQKKFARISQEALRSMPEGLKSSGMICML